MHAGSGFFHCGNGQSGEFRTNRIRQGNVSHDTLAKKGVRAVPLMPVDELVGHHDVRGIGYPRVTIPRPKRKERIPPQALRAKILARKLISVGMSR